MRLASPAADRFETHEFPTTTDELVAAHGDVELRLPKGAVTLGEVLSHMPNETLASAEEARLTTYSALGEDAIGRKGYSDRDATAPGEDGHERQSL
jgi:hypothetical protein